MIKSETFRYFSIKSYVLDVYKSRTIIKVKTQVFCDVMCKFAKKNDALQFQRRSYQ